MQWTNGLNTIGRYADCIDRRCAWSVVGICLASSFRHINVKVSRGSFYSSTILNFRMQNVRSSRMHLAHAQSCMFSDVTPLTDEDALGHCVRKSYLKMFHHFFYSKTRHSNSPLSNVAAAAGTFSLTKTKQQVNFVPSERIE